MPIPTEVPTRPLSTTTRAASRDHHVRSDDQHSLVVRKPHPSDGAQMWTVARDGGELDLNSSYAYLMMASDFTDTCRVAVCDNEIVGFVLGYSPPERPTHRFVWQVAVRDDQRGRGVAALMLEHLIAADDVDALEATVEETNTASRALFASIARKHQAELTWSDGIPAAHFPDGHAGEPRLRIAPLR